MEFLRSFEGKRVELFCGMNSMFAGVITSLQNDHVVLRDSDDRTVYVALDKVVAVRETVEHQSRPGFIA